MQHTTLAAMDSTRSIGTISECRWTPPHVVDNSGAMSDAIIALCLASLQANEATLPNDLSALYCVVLLGGASAMCILPRFKQFR